MMFLRAPVCFVVALVAGISAGRGEAAAGESLRIKLRIGELGEKQIVATGLHERLQKTFAKMDGAELARRFAVYVGEQALARPAMLGEVRLEGTTLVFQPRYPLEPGASYLAVLRLPEGDGVAEYSQRFTLDKPRGEPAVVTHVYPTSDVLPENQLKFYIHFSRPMSRGEAYRHVTLLSESGGLVEDPFLELGEELWDPTGTRFTLFFDPGRIKRGLKPREEVGPSLEEGKSYTLVIGSEWRDAHGEPLASEHRKPFRVTAPDDEQPAIDKWRLTAPPAGTRRPLEVQFPEPLDHAMLLRVLHLVDASGKLIDGKITVADQETRWRLTPQSPWRAGEYRLTVDAALEDRAGNSIRRPFEVDVLRMVETEEKVDTVSLPLTIEPAAAVTNPRG